MGHLNMNLPRRAKRLLEILNLLGARAESGGHEDGGRSDAGHWRERKGRELVELEGEVIELESHLFLRQREV